MQTITKLFFFMTVGVLISVCLGNSFQGDRCALDPQYSYRVCNALTTILLTSRAPCDKTEVIKLKRRIELLRKALKNLQRENMELTLNTPKPKPVKNCTGTVYGNKCFFLLDQDGLKSMVSYDKARNACRAHQGSLVSISSRALYNAVYDFIEKNAQDFTKRARSLVITWTGSLYRNRQIYLPDNVTRGFVEWSPYHPLNRTEWNKIGIAVSANPKSRGMFDVKPSTSMYPLCEKPIPS